MIINKPEEGKVNVVLDEETRREIWILRESDTLYTLMSDATRLPYVVCDEETFDDEILVFDREEKAKRTAGEIGARGYAVRAVSLSRTQRLAFFSSLFPMGVNAILLGEGKSRTGLIQLEHLIRRPEIPRFSEEIRSLAAKGEQKFLVENPEFHLTAIYYTQLARSGRAGKQQKELEALREEMMIHYREGYYLAARTEDGKMPLLRMKDGGNLQPIFTDMQEFAKFQHMNQKKKMKTAVMTEGEFLRHLAPEATGVAVNPFGISLVLRVNPRGKAGNPAGERK